VKFEVIDIPFVQKTQYFDNFTSYVVAYECHNPTKRLLLWSVFTKC
jgi:hypothetical protein